MASSVACSEHHNLHTRAAGPGCALGLQVLGCQAKALEAYEKAAHANVRGSGTAWHAGQHLRKAAQISKDMQDAKACATFAQRAAEHFVDAGKPGTGAECLGNAARWLESMSPCLAGRLYRDALALYAKDPMAAMAHDLVQRGVGIQIAEGQINNAADMLLQWAAVCADTKSTTALCRAYLGAPPTRVQNCKSCADLAINRAPRLPCMTSCGKATSAWPCTPHDTTRQGYCRAMP